VFLSAEDAEGLISSWHRQTCAHWRAACLLRLPA